MLRVDVAPWPIFTPVRWFSNTAEVNLHFGRTAWPLQVQPASASMIRAVFGATRCHLITCGKVVSQSFGATRSRRCLKVASQHVNPSQKSLGVFWRCFSPSRSLCTVLCFLCFVVTGARQSFIVGQLLGGNPTSHRKQCSLCSSFLSLQ